MVQGRQTDPAIVEEIRNTFIPGHPEFGRVALGLKFGLHPVTISRLYRGYNSLAYHLEEQDQPAVKRPQGENHVQVKMTAALVIHLREIWIPHDREFGSTALAKQYGVNVTTMNKAMKGETWRSIPMPYGRPFPEPRKRTAKEQASIDGWYFKNKRAKRTKEILACIRQSAIPVLQ